MIKSCFVSAVHNRKRSLLMILTAIALFAAALCSCGSSDKDKSITLQTVFCKKFCAEYDGTEFCGKVQAGEDITEFTLDSPETLKGAKITVNNTDKSMKVNVHGLDITLDSAKYPQAAFAAAFANAINDLSGNGGYEAVNGKINGEVNGLKYVITANENGDITKLEFKSLPLIITLSDC